MRPWEIANPASPKVLMPEFNESACRQCGVWKPPDQYELCGGSPRRVCRPCRARYQRDYWRALSPTERKERRRRKGLKASYNMTQAQYDGLFSSQDGVCAICARAPDAGRSLAVDHCHQTGRIRGLLCVQCNVALGMLQENPLIIIEALSYVLRHALIGRE